MIHHLMERLWAYIYIYHPDLMLGLMEDNAATQYLEEKVQGIMPKLEAYLLEGKPDYAAVELCLNELTDALKPSRFHYIKNILEEEFRTEYNEMREDGILEYEIFNMMADFKDEFDELGFSEENKDYNKVYYAIAGGVQYYLEQRKAE